MLNEKIFTVAVVGPTASGKTALAINLAKEFCGEIISADSMQIYKGMPIATACPTEDEKRQAVHHLVEFLEPTETFSVANFVSLAKEEIKKVNEQNKLPIIAGGTGLYVDSLLENIEFGAEKSNQELRQEIEKELQSKGAEQMLKELAEFDSQTASRLHQNDTKRIIRAFEVYRTSGISLSEQNEISRTNPTPYNAFYIGITFKDREKLYSRINLRVEKMLESGLLEEAKNFYKMSATAKQAIGHKELIPFFNGEISYDEAVENIKRETRRLAKRQLTWFRRNQKINWLYADECDINEQAKLLLERRIKENAK